MVPNKGRWAHINVKFSPGSYWSSSHWRSAYLVIGLVTRAVNWDLRVHLNIDGWPPILRLYFKVVGRSPVTGTSVGSKTEVASLDSLVI